MTEILETHCFKNGTRFEIVKGDITQEKVDAIVNAANEMLQHGGGVAGVISRKGGAAIQSESNEWIRKNGPVRHDSPAITSAGILPAKKVIHAVGPIWGSGDEDHKLRQAVKGSLEKAEELGLSSVAFPAISTGIFGFPKDRAAKVFFQTFNQYFSSTGSHDTLKLVRLTLFDEPTLQTFLLEYKSFNFST